MPSVSAWSEHARGQNRAHGGQAAESWLFYDAKCGGHFEHSRHAQSGWILGCRRPSETLAFDLQWTVASTESVRLGIHLGSACWMDSSDASAATYPDAAARYADAPAGVAAHPPRGAGIVPASL